MNRSAVGFSWRIDEQIGHEFHKNVSDLVRAPPFDQYQNGGESMESDPFIVLVALN